MTKDTYGNVRLRGGDSIVMELKGSFEFFDNKDGTYKVTFIPQQSERFDFKVNLNGEPINGSPFSIRVIPGEHRIDTC